MQALVFTSIDGSSWARRGSVSGYDAAGIGAPIAWNGRFYLALGDEPGGVNYGTQQNGAAWISDDLRSWTKAPIQSTFGGTSFRSLAGSPDGFVATGYSQSSGGSPAWFSPDGLHFSPVTGARPTDADTVEATGVVYANGMFVMVGRLNNDAASWTSRDGRTWTIHAPLAGGSGVVLTDLIRTASGYLSLGVGDPEVEVSPGVFYPTVAAWSSTNGIDWRSAAPSPALFGAFPMSLVAAPGGYVATGSVGLATELWTSPDGSHWDQVRGVDLSKVTLAWLASDGRRVILVATGPDTLVAMVSAGVNQ